MENKNDDSIALQAEIVLIKKKNTTTLQYIYILRNPLGLLLDSVELSFSFIAPRPD